MKLYEFPPTRSIRPRWVLQELGLPFESVTIRLSDGEHRTPEFLKLNPSGKIPVLVDGDFVLSESVAIALYLAEKYAEKRLFPTELRERAEAFRWLFFAATELEQPLWRIARHSFVYPEAQRIPADIPLARGEAIAAASVVDAHLAGRSYVVGERATVVDFVMAYTLDWADTSGCLDHAPHAASYLKRMYERPHAAPRIAEARRQAGLA
jgi:glutathione S-transferase